MKKLEKCLLECYKTVYKELGVDFDEIKDEENFFMNYEMENNKQQEIISKVMKEYKMSNYCKRLISTSYWLGCSPKDSAE